MIIFKLIQNHVLNCNKKECPGNILLPKSLSYSIFTDFNHYSNSIEEIEKSENNITLKNDEIKEKNKNINSSEIIKKSILVKNKSKDNINNRRKSKKIDINNNEDRYNNIKEGKINWPKEINDKDAKDLIGKILKINPNERLSLEEIEKHPWLIGTYNKMKEDKQTNDTFENKELTQTQIYKNNIMIINSQI